MDEQMIRKNNMKIFPIYKCFAWDLLFYYAISFLFLTQVKGFSASEVFLIDAIYAIFLVIFQILCLKIVDLIGKQKSLLLGNLLVSISILILILSNGLLWQIILNLLQALGYTLKGICEPTLLSDSIPKSSISGKIYSKIDGNGNSLYYLFDAISCAATGFLYIFNPYIPIIMCFICSLISTYISISFYEPPSSKTKNYKSFGFISYYKDIFKTFKKIIKSKRLKALLIFSLCFSAILAVFPTLRTNLLTDIGVPEQYFGIIFAVMQIISAVSSKKQHYFHKTFKNRTLTWFSLSMTTAFILTGLLVVCNINYTVSFVACLITIMIGGLIKGPYQTLISQYFNNFSNPEVNTKIYAVKSLLGSISRVILSLFISFLLGITTISNVFIMLGLIFLIIFIYLLDYMKTHVGLKPEQYPKEDLLFSDMK